MRLFLPRAVQTRSNIPVHMRIYTLKSVYKSVCGRLGSCPTVSVQRANHLTRFPSTRPACDQCMPGTDGCDRSVHATTDHVVFCMVDSCTLPRLHAVYRRRFRNFRTLYEGTTARRLHRASSFFFSRREVAHSPPPCMDPAMRIMVNEIRPPPPLFSLPLAGARGPGGSCIPPRSRITCLCATPAVVGRLTLFPGPCTPPPRVLRLRLHALRVSPPRSPLRVAKQATAVYAAAPSPTPPLIAPRPPHGRRRVPTVDRGGPRWSPLAWRQRPASCRP